VSLAAPEGTQVKIPYAPDMVNDYAMETTYESIFATIFVIVISGAPLVLTFFQDDRSKTNIIQTCVVVTLLVGGIVAFTTTIKFNSAHWEGARPLSIVESVYLLSQMLTTVGYGDITPAYPRGQVVVGFYVLCSILLIADMVGQVSTIVVNRLTAYSEKLANATDRLAAAARARLRRQQHNEGGEDDKEDDDDSVRKVMPIKLWKKPELQLMPIVGSGLCLTFFVTLGICFWHYYPGEERTWMQAIYMSVITLSTVGFGAFTAQTEGGMVFGAFWMLFGVTALVSFVSAFTELMMMIKIAEKWSVEKVADEMRDRLAKLEVGSDGKLDEVQFMKFALLQAGKCTEDDLEGIDARWKALEPRSGKVDKSNIEKEIPTA